MYDNKWFARDCHACKKRGHLGTVTLQITQTVYRVSVFRNVSCAMGHTFFNTDSRFLQAPKAIKKDSNKTFKVIQNRWTPRCSIDSMLNILIQSYWYFSKITQQHGFVLTFNGNRVSASQFLTYQMYEILAFVYELRATWRVMSLNKAVNQL